MAKKEKVKDKSVEVVRLEVGQVWPIKNGDGTVYAKIVATTPYRIRYKDRKSLKGRFSVNPRDVSRKEFRKMMDAASA